MNMSMACMTDILVRRVVDGRGRPSYGRFAIAAFMALGIASSVMAAEPTKPETTPLEAEADSAESESLPPTPPAEITEELPSTDQELMIAAPSDAEALLEAALAAMDQAVLELDGDEPTPAAVQSQQLAVDRLTELLEAASKSSSSSSSSSKNQSSSSPKDPSGSQDEQPSKTADSSGSGGRRADDENSAESSENVAGPMTPGSGVLAPGARGNSVWGHLPAREQESLLRSLSDTFLPEYESQIRRYYEALAERK